MLHATVNTSSSWYLVLLCAERLTAVFTSTNKVRNIQVHCGEWLVWIVFLNDPDVFLRAMYWSLFVHKNGQYIGLLFLITCCVSRKRDDLVRFSSTYVTPMLLFLILWCRFCQFRNWAYSTKVTQEIIKRITRSHTWYEMHQYIWYWIKREHTEHSHEC